MIYHKFNISQTVPGELSPRKIASRMISPPVFCLPPPPPDNYPRGKLHPQTITPEENCPQTVVPLDDCTWTITPKIIASWKLPPRKIVFRMNCCLHNCRKENCPPKNIVPRINYTQYIFSPRIRNRSTLINNCFLLF